MRSRGGAPSRDEAQGRLKKNFDKLDTNRDGFLDRSELRKALEEGFKEKKKLDEEPDFAGLREIPAFKELLNREPRVL